MPSSLPPAGSLNWASEEMPQRMQTSQHASATQTNQPPETQPSDGTVHDVFEVVVCVFVFGRTHV